MDRNTLLWMKDILEHLEDCFDQWQQGDSRTSRFLADAIDRDLVEFRRLCDSLRRQTLSTASRPTMVAT